VVGARADAGHLERVRALSTTIFGHEGTDDEQRLYESQFQARRLVEDLALGLQGSLLVRHAPSAVADAFCAGRLDGEGGRAFGTLPRGVDAPSILERALPI